MILIIMRQLTLCPLHYPKFFLPGKSWRVICLIPQGQTVTFLQHLDRLQTIISFWVVTEEFNIAILKIFLKKRESRKVENRRLDAWRALRDSTGKLFGNLLLSTFTTIILLTRLFRDIPQQGIWALMRLKSLAMLQKRLNTKINHSTPLGNPSWSNCDLTGY